MNEFLTFITSGVIEPFADKHKEKFLYLLSIIYYTLATLFTIAIVYQLGLYLKWGSFDATIIGTIDDIVDVRNQTLSILNLLLLPLISGFGLWFCLTRFSYEKVCLSFALISTTIIYIINTPLNLLPKIGSIGEYDITPYLTFLLATGILYLILSNILNHKLIKKVMKFWNENLRYITYVYVALFTIYAVSLFELNLINIVISIVVSSFLGFMLIYVRRLLGLRYAILLHYICIAPLLGIMIYMLVNNMIIV